MDPENPKHLVAAAENIRETNKGTDTQVLVDPVVYTVVSSEWATAYEPGDSPVKDPAAAPTPVAPSDKFPWDSSAIGIRGPVVYVGLCGSCGSTFRDARLIKAGIATNSEPGCTAKTMQGSCWHVAKGIGLPKAQISSVVVDPDDTRTVYVAMGQDNPFEFDDDVTGAAKVLVSHDSGDHFSNITRDLPRAQVRALVYRAGKLIAASEVGLFTAKPGGDWSRLGRGLPTGVVARDLYLDPTGRYLVAGMYGRGIWELDFGATARNSNSPEKTPDRDSHGPLATTGTTASLGIVAFLLLVAAGVLGRRRRAP
jgi:hypothetical protein